HIATICSQTKDTCATCGGEHRTKSCDERGKQWCVSCNSNTHSSWDRDCPSFQTKCANMDKRNLEASLPYYPSEEAYTWLPAIQPHHLQIPSHSRPY
ncbi:hypothetical protein BDQ17DRAFT_1262245, partial [Cyathus striatus]